MKRSLFRVLARGSARVAAVTIGCLLALPFTDSAHALAIRFKLPILEKGLIERPGAALAAMTPEARARLYRNLSADNLALKLAPEIPPISLAEIGGQTKPAASLLTGNPLFEAVPLGERAKVYVAPSLNRVEASLRIEGQPEVVLGHLLPQAGGIAMGLSREQQRRALVVVGHDDKLSLQELRRQADLSPNQALDIVDSICAIVAEAALPADAAPINSSDLADKFVLQLERARDRGLANMDPDDTRVWARAMQAANDPSMQAKVSDVRKDYGAGTVSFHVIHPQFSAGATYRVIGFAAEVAKAPNQPNAARLANLWK